MAEDPENNVHKPITVEVVDDDDEDDEVSDVSDKFDRMENCSPVGASSPPPSPTSAARILQSAKDKIHRALRPMFSVVQSTMMHGSRRRRRRTQSENSQDQESDDQQEGATTSATTPSAATATQRSSAVVAAISPMGEQELEQLIDEAEYEIHQDPYRGILSHQQSLETQVKITTPWHVCEWGSLRPEPIEGIDDLEDPQLVVRHIGNCACPSLKEWTRTRILADRNKKISLSKKRRRNATGSSSAATAAAVVVKPRFQVGVRPPGESFVCPCDFNPLCLATLGGVVNDLMEERCRDLDAFVPIDTEDEIGSSSSSAKTPPPAPPPPSLISHYIQKKRPVKETLLPQEEGDDCDAVEVLEGPPSPPTKKQALDKKKITTTPNRTEIVDIDMMDDQARVVHQPGNGADDESSDPFTFVKNSSPAVASPTKSHSRPTVRRRTPPLLEPPVQEGPRGNPMDVFIPKDGTQQQLSCMEFSCRTNEALKQCRSSVEVDTASIRSYAHQKLKMPLADGGDDGDKDRITVDKFIKFLREWHDQLLFVNPVTSHQSSASDKILLSMPPGIANLGATCYLNSQLQCLAQNLTFLNGIFSWHVVDETHRMNSVMTKLQLLLAQMFLGGESKLTTLEFSDALGLEHYEQQDPNEFARLLFDRMDESFQQCDNDGDLSNLLNRIFHGVSTYETICLTCGKKSERNEGFMDLNLPIVKPPKRVTKKSGTIEEAFVSMSTKDVDTNVQFCLDEYTCEEMLDGENQYFCSECDQKRDAKRILKLTELPPVLNVQLSRYVFDRTKFTKKKVCDKVLLPTSLNVTTGGAAKKYLLCAVMRHQGNSAYSGHYLAEAMDWMSGKWFEFNDEIVKLLPDGPSSSFDPDEDTSSRPLSAGESGRKAPLLVGSQDAYNMYYVEEGYLSKAVHAAVTWRKELCHKGPNAGEVLDDVTDLRKEQFKALSILFLDDAQVFDRLHRRKLGIRKYLLPSARSLVPSNSNSGRFVWVTTKFLRKYLKCQPDDELDSLLESCDPIMQNNVLRCPHGEGLEPRVAQTGKLLSLQMYDTLVALLRGERALLRGAPLDATVGDDTEIEDYMIGSDINMICKECSAAHRDKLLLKLRRIRSAKALFDALDATTGDAELEYDDTGATESAKDSVVYAIPRQLAVKFRRKIKLLMKSLTKMAGGVESNTKSSPNDTVASCEGLGAVDMSSIACEDDDLPTEFRNFNESITCSHGNLLPLSGRQVQYISNEVWQMIKELFPASVDHPVRRTLKGSPDSANVGCLLCTAEKDSVEQLRGNLQTWAKKTKDEAALKSLLDTKRTLPQGLTDANFLNASNGSRLIHKSDVSIWRDAIKVLSNLKKIKGDSVDTVRAFVETLVFPSRHAIVLEFETTPIDKFGASLRSFICREHHRVVQDAILESPATCNGESTRKLARYVTVVSDVEYEAYMDSVASLLCILSPDKPSAPRGVGNVGGETKGMLISVRKIANSHHPSIQWREPSDTDTNRYLQLSLDGSLKEFTLSPSMCLCETCSKEYTPLLLSNNEKDDERVESISVGSNEARPSSKLKVNAKRGSGASDPILVESDMEEDPNKGMCRLRVFQVKQGSSEEEMFKSLREVSAIAADADAGSEVRRSSRKRKQIYPVGVLLSEETIDICVHYNVAAICLLMFQSGIQIDFSKLFVVMHQPFENPKMIETTTSNKDLELTIPQIIGDDGKNVDIINQVILLYERHHDRPDGNAVSVNDDLFHFSNIHDDTGAAVTGSDNHTRPKKKTRASERGFQGTLLQGFRSAASSASDGGGKEVEGGVDVLEGPSENPNDGGNYQKENMKPTGPSVVVDDSSVVSTRASSISTPKREVSSDDDNSDDARILTIGPTFRPSPQNKKDAKENGGDVIDMATAENGMNTEILQKLMDALSEVVGATDQERCGLAATMALSFHPDGTEIDFDELLASALGSYYTNN